MLIALFTVFISASDTSAAATGNSPEDVSSATTDELAPTIVSKNIVYASRLHLLYAIPAEGIDDNASLFIEIYSSDPSVSTPDYLILESELSSISSITGEASDYHVFASGGIAAKNIATELYAIPVLVDGDGAEHRGEAVKYSVAEYCYERLCDDGYNAISDEGSEDMLRRRLYEALLDYGEKAYLVLGSDTAPSPKNIVYASVSGSQSDFSSLVTEKKLTVTLDPSLIPANHLFAGWSIIHTSTDGTTTEALSDSTSITVELKAGGTSVRAKYTKDPATLRAEEIANAEKTDEQNRAKQWTALESALVTKLGYSRDNAVAICNELKNLYTLYGTEMVEWAASLYSKGYMDIENGIWAGGFYASTAGRDAFGYGPDLQSTVQLLRFLQQSGIISSISNDIPEWMQIEMVYFAKSLQDENGYFYHPQWGKEFTDTKISRRGRDLGWGTSLLSYFGAQPEYDTPNSVRGDGMSADEYLESLGISKPTSYSSLTSYLGGSATDRVRSVVLVSSDTDSSTAYLATNTAFIDYLLTVIEPGMRTNQYGTGNIINATTGQISYYSNLNGVYAYAEGDEALTAGATAADYMRFDGMTMNEMLMDVLLNTVNPVTGLYGGYNSDGRWSDTLNFSHSNGFFKVISIFNSRGVAYPEAARAAVSLIDNLTNPDLPSTGNACDVYNVWNAINSLDSNSAASTIVYAIITDTAVTVASENDEGAEAMTVTDFIAKSLEIRGADAVRITFDKIKGYKKSDGAFSHSYTSGGTNHQDCPIAPAGNNVGDVDATCIASTGLVRSLFDAFNMGSYRPSFFGEADYMRFIDKIESMAPIRKANSEILIEDFEDDRYNNDIVGDHTISDGKLSIVGTADIYASTLSTIGPKFYFELSLSLSESAEFTVYRSGGLYSEDKAMDSFTVSLSADRMILQRKESGSFAYLDLTNGSAKLTVAYSIADGKLVAEVFSDSLLIMREDLECELSNLSDIKRVTVSSERGAEIDDMIFATLTPTHSNLNDSGRLDFTALPEGELDVSLLSGNLSFVNQTQDGENKSYALIVVNGSNKFLRLDDNWSQGSASQNYFDFKTDAALCKTSVFEAKMRITKESGGVIPITVLSPGGAAYYGALGTSDGYVYAGVASSKSNCASSLLKTAVSSDEWFTLRLEYTAAEEYSEDTFLVSIYVNNILISESREKCNGLTYCSSSAVNAYRMACDTNWLGMLDYDDIYIGSKENYKPIVESDKHIHFVNQTVTDLVEYTCTENGSYTLITTCSDENCGKHLSTAYIVTPMACRPGDPVIENSISPSCYSSGSYDEVEYCTECGKELSRETVTLPMEHTVATRVENRVESTCTEQGRYDEITYCALCSVELKKESFVIPTAPHNVVGSSCTECGGTDFVIDGMIDFEDIEEKSYISASSSTSNANLPTASNGSFIHLYAPSAHAEMAVVTEGENKLLVCEKVMNTTSSNTWVDFIRDTSIVAEEIIFESRFKYDYTSSGGGIYVRLYTGRTTSGNGTRVTYHTIKPSGGYFVYQSVKTHVAVGDWCTVRISLTKTADGYLYSFLIKNESGAAITFNGVSYGEDEYIPYYTTTELLIDLESINDVNAITFMHSTGCLSTVSFDDVYFGGTPTYISRSE